MNKKFITLFLITLTLSSTAMPTAKVYVGTDLHIAARKGDLTWIKKLLNDGHNIDAQDWSGATPLHIAIAHNKLDCFQEFIASNANVNIPDTKEGWTPLHTAVNINNPIMVRILLEHGAAVMIGNAECVKMLLAHNPNIFAQDDYSQTVLHVAVRYFHADFLMLLLEHLAQKKAYIINEYGYAGNREFITELIAEETSIDPKDNNGNTPLHYAAFKGCIQAAEILIANGANLFARNGKNQTPLDVALYAGREIASILQAKEKVTSENLTKVVERLAMAQYLEQRMKTLIS